MTAQAKDVQGAQLTDFLEGNVDGEEQASIELLLSDPAVRAEMEAARAGRDLLSELGTKPTPQNFLRKVQRRVRRKSGGRHFHPAQQPFGFGLSIEVFVVVAVAVMAACWMILDIGRQTIQYDVFIPPTVERPAPTIKQPTVLPAPLPQKVTPPTTPPPASP